MSTFGPGRMRMVAFGVLAATFLVGALAGAAVDRVLLADETEQVDRRADRDDGRDRRHLIDQIEKTPEQEAAIAAILERRGDRMRAVWSEMSPRMEAIADSTRSEIMQVLTPAQRAEYEAKLERRRAHRERDDDGRDRDRNGDKGDKNDEGDPAGPDGPGPDG